MIKFEKKMKYKKIILVLLAVILFAPAFSQKAEKQKKEKKEFKTIFGDSRMSDGWYGALTVNFTQFNDDDAILIGAKGGWIINQAFTLGLAGYGIANDVRFDNVYQNKEVFLSGGYGGILLEPIVAPRFPVHIAFPIIIGAGGVAYVDDIWNSYNDNWDYEIYDSDAFFVVEPGAEIEFNAVRFLRIGIGASYRFTSNLDLDNAKTDLLKGFSFGFSLKFGKFWNNRWYHNGN